MKYLVNRVQTDRLSLDGKACQIICKSNCGVAYSSIDRCLSYSCSLINLPYDDFVWALDSEMSHPSSGIIVLAGIAPVDEDNSPIKEGDDISIYDVKPAVHFLRTYVTIHTVYSSKYLMDLVEEEMNSFPSSDYRQDS